MNEVTPDKLPRANVRYGTLERAAGGVLMSLEQVYKHPGYTHFKANDDIGLLKTKSDIQFTKLVRPLKLAKKQDLRGRLVSLAGK